MYTVFIYSNIILQNLSFGDIILLGVYFYKVYTILNSNFYKNM